TRRFRLTRFVIPSPRTCWIPAQTCATSRNSSDTRGFQRRKSTRTFRWKNSLKFMTVRIRKLSLVVSGELESNFLYSFKKCLSWDTFYLVVFVDLINLW